MKLVNRPEDCGLNGIDDLLAAWGPDRVLDLFNKPETGTSLHVVLPPQFHSTPEGIFRTIGSGEQLQQVQLSTYRAAITRTSG